MDAPAPYREDGREVVLDVAESRDLSEDEPAIRRELLALWEDYVRQNGVIVPTRDMSYATGPARRMRGTIDNLLIKWYA